MSSPLWPLIVAALSPLAYVHLGLAAILCLLAAWGWRRRNRLRLALRQRGGRKLLIFDAVDDTACQLAHSAAQTQANGRQHPLVIICHACRKQDSQQRGYLSFYGRAQELLPQLGSGPAEFFFVSADGERNTSSALALARLLEESYPQLKEQTTLHVRSSQPEHEPLLDSLSARGFDLRLENPELLTAYRLLWQYPLYQYLPPKAEQLHVLIMGGGSQGRELLKAVLCCGQLNSVRLRVSLIDPEAERALACWRHEAPELDAEHGYDLRFYTADPEGSCLEQQLFDHCPDVDYAIVALGGDSLNLKTAHFLRAYYLRRSYQLNHRPGIFALVNDAALSQCLEEWSGLDLIPFAARTSRWPLVEDELTGLASGVHGVWEPVKQRQAVRRGFRAEAENMYSSLANAVHLRYKLWELGLELRPAREEDDLVDGYQLFAEQLARGEALEQLIQLEHRRWMAFVRGRGWQKFDLARAELYCQARIDAEYGQAAPWPEGDEAARYAVRRRFRKHSAARLHVCNCDWDDLVQAGLYFDPLLPDLDRRFIVEIPEILSDVWKISGQPYLIVRRPAAAGQPLADTAPDPTTEQTRSSHE